MSFVFSSVWTSWQQHFSLLSSAPHLTPLLPAPTEQADKPNTISVDLNGCPPDLVDTEGAAADLDMLDDTNKHDWEITLETDQDTTNHRSTKPQGKTRARREACTGFEDVSNHLAAQLESEAGSSRHAFLDADGSLTVRG
jgi:hypothetical protein